MRIPLLLSLGAALALALGPAGCASTDEDETSIGEGTDDYTAQRGGLCGGFAGTRCGEGLRCNYNRGLNTGTCVDDPSAATQGAGEGETCGGTARIKCKAGLDCKRTTGAIATGTLKGKCTAAAVTCLAIPTCDDGHTKVASPDACLQDDAACYKRSMCGRTIWCTGPSSPAPPTAGGTGAGPGQMCGGFAGTTCRAGLRCDNSLGINTGYCR
jgi:hypothetical protein